MRLGRDARRGIRRGAFAKLALKLATAQAGRVDRRALAFGEPIQADEQRGVDPNPADPGGDRIL